MKGKTVQVSVDENDLKVDLTLHDMPASLLEDFAVQLVTPYFKGSLATAIKELIQRAIVEQELVASHINRK